MFQLSGFYCTSKLQEEPCLLSGTTANGPSDAAHPGQCHLLPEVQASSNPAWWCSGVKLMVSGLGMFGFRV